MSSTLLDKRQYAKLLAEAQPAVIQSEGEYRRLLSITNDLMVKPDEDLTAEEGRLLELLGMVIEEYEDRVHPLPKAEPHKMLAHLLREKKMHPSALWTILPKSRVSEILNGRRGISKSQAKRLAELLHVPVDLFL